MAFAAAMDSMAAEGAKFQLGENGSVEYTASGVGDAVVALFFSLVRGADEGKVRELLKPLVASDSATAESVALAFETAFQTRDCRGGKGERQLFVDLMVILTDAGYAQTVASCMDLVPEYGSYKDLWLLATKLEEGGASAGRAVVVEAVVDLYAATLQKDAAAAKKTEMTLAAKWAPREGKRGSAFAKKVAERMFQGAVTSRALYRKHVAKLNAALGTVETFMCANDFGSVEPSKVPSGCMFRNRKALLNEDLKRVPATAEEKDTGNRRPDDAGRIDCRKRVRAAVLDQGAKKLKAKQLFPHELVRVALKGKRSDVENDILNSQWATIRDNVVASISTAAETAAGTAAAASSSSSRSATKNAVDLGNLVPLVDVSGSMMGIPMEVAIALGLLVSEVTAPAFRDRVLTFESQPKWFSLDPTAAPTAKIEALKAAPWGGSTDFECALQLILDACVEHKLAPDQIPDLIVFSDMQFNQAHRPRSVGGGVYETHHAAIVRNFAEAGNKVCGLPYPAPRLIYWNLRSNTTGFPTDATEPNVKLLSGFSPALLKCVLEGEEVDDEEEGWDDADAPLQDQKKKKKKTTDPAATARKTLADKRYDLVRVKLAASTEARLADFAFTPAVVDEDDASTVLVSKDDDDCNFVFRQ